MKKKKMFNKVFSTFLILIMVFAMLAPTSAFANTDKKPFKSQLPNESTLELKAAIAAQQKVLNGGPTLHRDLQNLSGNEEVAVIIHLSEKPVALEQGISELKGKSFSRGQASKVKEKVQAQQVSVKKKFSSKGISLKQGYTFDTVLNGFAATVKADDLNKILSIEGVTLIEPDAIVYASEGSDSTDPADSADPNKSTNPADSVDPDESTDPNESTDPADSTEPNAPTEQASPTQTDSIVPPVLNTELEPVQDGNLQAMMNTSISFLGIERLWDEGIEGQGIKVAVLDTGIDAKHPEFAGIYKGGKNFIPNSSTYTKPRADDDASETSPVERPAGTPEFNATGSAFYTSHGTHVAGTIAAIGANEYGIKGIAPKVDLYAYRVLGAYGSGSSSGIVKAIDTAVIEGMDVINLSLGGGANSETDAGSFAINNAMIAGTIGVIATGNDGPNRGTMGTPGTARLGIAVGNTTNPETMYNGQVNVTVGDYNLTKQLQLMGTTFGKDLATQLQGEFDLAAVPGNGEVKDFEGINVEGKVALISRGSIAFVDKIANAKANGAVATIIHNFAGGTGAPNPSGTFLGDSFAFLPTFDMSQTDGEAIRAALAEGTGKVSFGNFASTSTLGDEVNDSSSRGPSTPNFDIKPDVSAPGTNIMSTIPMYKTDFPEAVYDEAYDRKTGTSMATPHIAGIAALVKQANPDWSAFDVKVALSNTAKVLNKSKYDVFAQGAGRVDAYAAAHANILAYAIDTAVLDGSGEIVENLKGTVTFGPQSLKENVSVTKQILVKEMKSTGGSYDVTVDTVKTFGDATVTVDQPLFTPDLDGEHVINVTLTASKAAAPNGSEILGYIHIKGGSSEISLPFAADFSGVAPTEIKGMSITETDLSFDGDGVKDSAELTFTLTGPVTKNYIELWDIMNPEGGEDEDGYIGYIHAGDSLGANSWKLTVDGEYQPWSGEPATTIPDGLYTIDFTGAAASGVISDYVGPVVVKTTKPEITGSVKDGVATGQVTDKYIEYNEQLYLYGLEYDLNEKLDASYIATVNGEATAPVAFDLDEDGSFTIQVTSETDSVKVVVTDAAGNEGEELIYEKEIAEPVLSLSVNPTKLDLTTGNTSQLTVKETSTPVEGEATEKDVTEEAEYKVVNDEVASVTKEGLVTAKAAGETTITVKHGGKEVQVQVKVTVTIPTTTTPGGNPGTSNPGTGNPSPVITNPGIPTPPTNPTSVVADDKKVDEQVKDTKTTSVEVTVPAPTADKPKVNAEVSATALKAIADSGKSFVMKAGETGLTVPSDVLKEISKNGNGKTNFEINLDKDAKVPGNGTTVSSVYDFEITVEKDGKTSTVSTFSKPIMVSVPVNASAVKNADKVAAYHVNEKTNALEYVGSKYANGKVTFKTNHFSKFVVVENNKTFKDLEKSWAIDYIESLASKTIINGKTEDTFAPNDQITRAQFALLLTRSLNLSKEEYQGIFSDVIEDMTWSVYEIEAANRAGIIVGSDGKFNPNEKITRQQMATMIVRAIKYNDDSALKEATGKVKFADEATIGDYAKENVALAAELGIISGKEVNGKQVFAPLENATRAQASKMLYHLLGTF